MQVITTPLAARVAGAVSQRLGLPEPLTLETTRFGNGQLEVRCPEAAGQGDDVVIFQVFADQVHDRLIELLLALDLIKARGARTIAAVLPYLPYSRSDRPAMEGGPTPARLIASLIGRVGLSRLVTIELHAPQLAGLFDCPVIHIPAAPILARRLGGTTPAPLTVVSPDFGGAKRAESLAAALGCPFAVLRKSRAGGDIRALELLGDIRGRHAVLVDDEINSGRTAASAALRLSDCGALSVALAAAHGLFTPDAAATLKAGGIGRVVVTDSAGPVACAPEGVEVVPIADAVADCLGPPLRTGRAGPRTRG